MGIGSTSPRSEVVLFLGTRLPVFSTGMAVECLDSSIKATRKKTRQHTWLSLVVVVVCGDDSSEEEEHNQHIAALDQSNAFGRLRRGMAQKGMHNVAPEPDFITALVDENKDV